jgi:hypothetical protein
MSGFVFTQLPSSRLRKILCMQTALRGLTMKELQHNTVLTYERYVMTLSRVSQTFTKIGYIKMTKEVTLNVCERLVLDYVLKLRV